MRILLLSQWYLPEPQEFLGELAESLQQSGHEVTVLTGFPNWPSGKLFPGYRIRLWQREAIGGVPIIRVPLFPDHSPSPLKRAANFISIVVSLTLLGPWLAPRVDAIHVIPPLTMGWPAWVISRLRRIPFTYEIQDMWPETLRATGMLNYESALKLIDLFAKWVYRRAAAIRVISPGFKANLVGKGVSAEKIHVISNWVDTAFFRPLEADPALAQKFGLASRFNIMYAGTIGLAQGLDTFIEAAELLKDIPDLQFVLVGDGADLKRLQGMAAERQINNVGFLGRHPIEMMPHFYSLADVLFLHLRDDPLFRITIPHKIFTYLACGKPILVAVEGDASQVILDAQAGMVCPPSNPAALADTVLQLYRLSPSDRRAIGENGRRAAVELYTRENLVAQIEKMIGRASQNKSRHKDLLLSHLFYLQESHAIKEFNAGNSIDAGYTVKLWRPGRGKIVPPQLSPKPFLVWWLFHQLGIFKNEDYAVLGIYKGDKLTHRSSVFPGYFRFPFMAIDDLQIGDTWTAPDHRCRGLSTHAIHQILRLCGKPGRRFWYVTDKENIASIRVVEKTGFSKVGEGCRTKRLGHSLFGTFSIMA